MPHRPARPCRHPGCHRTAARGRFCPAHARAYEGRRPSAARRGYDARHRRWRRMVLARHPLCRCGAPAVVADHRVPLSAGGDWSLENGQGMCLSCHNAKTARERVGA
jgi:5-methylcytosine-specific restriction protein A